MKWPDNGAPADFNDLVDPLIRAFSAAATWHPKTSMAQTDIEWTGLPLPHIGAGCPEARLSASWREHDRDQGRTFLQTILGLAVNLGMEQGRRVEWERQETSRRAVLMAAKTLEHVLEAWNEDWPASQEVPG